jgi:hypothetical protein
MGSFSKHIDVAVSLLAFIHYMYFHFYGCARSPIA